MYPYINLGPLHLGTFGLLLWLGAVAAAMVLQRNFARNGVGADALSVVAVVVVAGSLPRTRTSTAGLRGSWEAVAGLPSRMTKSGQ